MATQYKMNLKGLGEYLEALDKAGIDIADVTAIAVEEGAGIIQEKMLRLVPRKSHNLANHVRVVMKPIGNDISAEVGVIHSLEYTDAKTAIYGNVQEYGSAHTPAHPYIRPGFRAGRRPAMTQMRKILAEYLE